MLVKLNRTNLCAKNRMLGLKNLTHDERTQLKIAMSVCIYDYNMLEFSERKNLFLIFRKRTQIYEAP